MNQIYALLLLSVFISSCQGQNNNKQAATEIVAGQPKLIKPLGTDPYTNIRCSLQDRNGNIWFATTGAGVYKYDGKAFINFTEKDYLNSNIVYSMLEDKEGNIWFGTNNGICYYNGKNLIRTYIPGMARYDKFHYNGAIAPNGFSYERSVLSILQDKAGNIWFGTGAMGLYRYDGRDFTNFKYRDSTWHTTPEDSLDYNDSYQKTFIQCMMEDKAGNIWFSTIGAGNGVYCYNGKTFAHLAFDARVKSTIGAMMQDKTGGLWFSTWDDGIVRYDGKSLNYLTTKEGLCDNFVSCMVQDNSGTVWLGSSRKEEAGRTQGCITQYDGKTYKRLPLQGLGNTAIWSLLQDKSGAVWIGARNVGLYKYDGKSFVDFTGGEAK